MDDHEAYHLLAHLGLVWPAFESGLFFPGKPGMAGDLVFPKRALDARCMSAIWALDVTLLQLVFGPSRSWEYLEGAPQPKNPGLHLDLRPHEVFEEEEVAERLVECRLNIWKKGLLFKRQLFRELFHESLGPVDIWDVFETYSKHLPMSSHNFPINPMVFVATLQRFFWSVTSLASQPGTEHLAEVMSTESWMKRRRFLGESFESWQPRPAIWWVNHGLIRFNDGLMMG